VTPASARRRYALVSFLSWLPTGLVIAPMILLMTVRGLGVAQIGVVMGVYAAVVVLLELPTGGLTDVLGRRGVLALSALVAAAGMVVLAFADSVPVFLAASVLKGVARALSSGPAQAWYVDTVHAVQGRGADLKPGLARGEAMGSTALCAGVLIGGFLPPIVPGGGVEPLAVPVLLGAVAAVALLVVVLFALPEPVRVPAVAGRGTSVLREVPRTIAAGLRLAARDRVLARMLTVSVTAGVALCAIELLTPGRLAELTGDPATGSTAYGLVAAAGFAGSAVGSSLAPLAARLAGSSARGAMAGYFLAAAAMAVLAASARLPGAAGLAFAAGAYVVLFVGLSTGSLLRTEIMHGRIGPGQRATLLSIDSLGLQSGGFAANLGLAALAAGLGTAAAWWSASAVLLISVLLCARLPSVGRVAIPVRDAPG
jgi:hypothetical protein